jgi:hypothetical protein
MKESDMQFSVNQVVEAFGVLGIFPRKRTKASVAPAIPGLPDGVTSHFLTVLEYFG